MPTPKKRTAKDGTDTWTVRFRSPAGRNSSKAFAEYADARWFADQIEQRGVPFALRSLRDLIADTSDTDDSPALSTVFDEFLAWKRPYLRSTRSGNDYQRAYDDTIAPTFGALPIASITPTHVTDWVQAMIDGRIRSVRNGDPLSPKTIAGRHSLLHAVMKYAADPRRGYIEANPCAVVTLPKRIKPAPKGIMPAEWQALYKALRADCTDAADLAAFLLGSGWRWSEGAALTPADVEDYGPQSAMYVTMNQVIRRDDGTAIPEGKGQASIRRTQLDPDVAAIVRGRLIGRGLTQPVFCSPDGDHWTYNEFRVRWRRAVSVANLSRKPTPHWLRHTHVGWMVMAGASLPELQARIGHASIQTTIGVYGRMISDVGGDTLAAFTAMRDAAPQLAASTEPAALPAAESQPGTQQ